MVSQATCDHGDRLPSSGGMDAELPYHQLPAARSQATPLIWTSKSFTTQWDPAQFEVIPFFCRNSKMDIYDSFFE